MSKLSKHKDALADHPVDWKSHEYGSSLVFTMPHGLETSIEVTERKGVYSISLASTPWGTNKCLIENLKPEWVLPYTSGGERFHEAVKALWQKYKKPRARWTGHVIKVDGKSIMPAPTLDEMRPQLVQNLQRQVFARIVETLRSDATIEARPFEEVVADAQAQQDAAQSDQ